MSLKQKSEARPIVDPPRPGGQTHPGIGRSRWLGFVLVVAGVLLMALAAGDAFADTSPDSDSQTLRGSESGERLGGSVGDDYVNGFGGDDVLSGGGGDDEIYGGAGRDVMSGGSGEDFIEAKDGAPDYVDCGPGEDVASVDAADQVAPNCETVYPG